MRKIIVKIFIFIGWVVAANFVIPMSIFGWLSGYMPLWLFFAGVFVITLPIAWYLAKDSEKKSKWDWK